SKMAKPRRLCRANLVFDMRARPPPEFLEMQVADSLWAMQRAYAMGHYACNEPTPIPVPTGSLPANAPATTVIRRMRRSTSASELPGSPGNRYRPGRLRSHCGVRRFDHL